VSVLAVLCSHQLIAQSFGPVCIWFRLEIIKKGVVINRAVNCCTVIWMLLCNVNAGCCIYEKPRIFGQSDDESDDDDDDHGCTDHCRGHGKKDYCKSADHASSGQSPDKDGAGQTPGPPRDIGASN